MPRSWIRCLATQHQSACLREQRPSARSRGYNARWDKARATYLAHNPYCKPCQRAGIKALATHVDHLIPHRGDQTLFWDKNNWMGLCSTCHNGDKQKAEKSGSSRYRGCHPDGTPLDPGHRWNQPKP
jgi:5-methylcytosine-specific restriction protein A